MQIYTFEEKTEKQQQQKEKIEREMNVCSEGERGA